MPTPGFSFTILSFLLVIGPLVFIHEMGHYWVARWFGVHAETFSIGFGPEVAHWIDKRGTRWRIGGLPLGGYVRFAGDMGVASEPDPKWLELPPEERNRCFHVKPVWQRALIVLAGPVVNLLFGALILAGFAYAYGVNVTPAEVRAVVPKSAAEAAGVKPGDRILAFDRETIPDFGALALKVALDHQPGERVDMIVERNGKQVVLPITIGERIERDRFGNETHIAQIGVMPVAAVARKVSLIEAPVVGLQRTADLMVMVWERLSKIIMGQVSVKELGGPLKTAQFSGERAALGPEALISFIALISINLGFINLLPIPMLDGGHLFFYGIETIQRRPVSPRVQEIAFRSGLALLLGLMVLVTINDLGSFGLWRGLSRLIG
ncbi:MAG: RIP metalloprotease RseP [Sphingobium sp.]|nr:RIP metalloprotease RseP [Sphingobium sp.]